MTIQTKHKNHTERGISLLIVLLVGTIIILTSIGVGEYATRLTTSLRARSDAVQALYSAEGAFNCVRYWLNQDYRHFSTRITETGGGDVAICNGQTFDFNSAGPQYVLSGGTGTGIFEIDTTPLPGSVRVEVDRVHADDLYDGDIRVYSRSVGGGSEKATERFQEYHYYVLYGADIMFVVDRSGSIEDGGDRANRVPDNEWNRLLDAVNSSIRLLIQKVPSPRMGLVSFGTDATDTGVAVSPTNPECLNSGSSDCTNANWRAPDVQLTTVLGDLIDDNGTPANYDDDIPQMGTGYSATNLSLGLSVAGAELMGKYYPHSGEGAVPVGLHPDAGSGAFERIVATNGDFNDLPPQDSPADRNDVEFPDVIVLVTDGAPNAIMTHVGTPVGSERWWSSPIFNTGDFIGPALTPYPLGSVKLFRTLSAGSGALIVDDDTSSPTVVPPNDEYEYCYDPGGAAPAMRPSSPGSPMLSPVDTNTYPHYAMCNSTLIANKLYNDENIKIIAIYVTADDSLCNPSPSLPDEAIWLRDQIAHETPESEKLFAVVCDYDEVRDAILELFEKLELQESR